MKQRISLISNYEKGNSVLNSQDIYRGSFTKQIKKKQHALQKI